MLWGTGALRLICNLVISFCSRPYPIATTRCTSDLVIGTDLLVLQCGSALPHLVPELACPGTKVDQVFQAGQSAA